MTHHIGSLWRKLTDWISAPFRPREQKLAQKDFASKVKVAHKVMSAKMLRIPSNASASVPQKR